MRVFVIFLFLLASSFVSAKDNQSRVIVSIKPIHSIVTGLMKDIDTPELLISGSKTPYDFTPTAATVKKLQSAKLVIWVGAELEKNMQPVITQLPSSVKVVELLANQHLKILPSRSDPSLRDPFFWMDDRNVMILVDELTKLFIQMDPARTHLYERNRREVMLPLRRIDKEYEYGYRGFQAGMGVAYFDTLQYFEQAYALNVLERVAGTPWQKEKVVNLLKVRNHIQNKEAACLFLDTSMHAASLALLEDGQKVNIGELDVLGRNFTAGADLYVKLMQYNTDIIKKCLNANMDVAATARVTANNEQDNLPDGIKGRFILTDHRGTIFTERDMQGKYALIFFGYTHCPDVCPTTLMVLTQALKQLDVRAAKLVPYFITVDPERDTANIISEYVKYFDKRIVGLTGSKQMIDRVVEQFKAKYQKVENKQDPLLYTMDHTASFYLMAPDGRFITKFAYGISPEVLANKIAEFIR